MQKSASSNSNLHRKNVVLENRVAIGEITAFQKDSCRKASSEKLTEKVSSENTVLPSSEKPSFEPSFEPNLEIQNSKKKSPTEKESAQQNISASIITLTKCTKPEYSEELSSRDPENLSLDTIIAKKLQFETENNNISDEGVIDSLNVKHRQRWFDKFEGEPPTYSAHYRSKLKADVRHTLLPYDDRMNKGYRPIDGESFCEDESEEEGEVKLEYSEKREADTEFFKKCQVFGQLFVQFVYHFQRILVDFVQFSMFFQHY